MLGFTAKKLLQQLSSGKAVILHHQSHSFRAFLSSTVLKSSTSLQSESKDDAFTVSYLVNSCGVSVDAANKISKYFHLKSAEKPSRTLNFLRCYGFTDVHISSIITVSPYALHSDPVKTLKPKFDLFIAFGASHEAMLKIIRNCPLLLAMNLEKRLVPVLDSIKSIVASNEKLITLLTRSTILRHRTFGPNVAFLRDIGMPERCITRFVMLNGNAFRPQLVKFKVMVDRALAMGFNIETSAFGDAINTFASLTEENWEKKVEIFRKWGWSESEFKVAFTKRPRIMFLSEAKIEGTMDYLVNKMGLDASYLAKQPHALSSSLKNRIIPRCPVVRVLLSKGLIKKDYSLNSVIMSTDEYFMKTFVEKHAGMSSELLSLYHSLKH
ncbi:hypothetical protein QQ045_028999 [Rhodiola kirilowii]